MKNIARLSLIGFSLLAVSAKAQITVTQNDFAQVGDTLFYAHDTTDAASDFSLESGSNRSWDISGYGIKMVSPSYFISPNASPIPAPTNITHVLVDSDAPQDATFLNVNSTGMETIIPNPLTFLTGGESFIRLKSLSFPATYLTQVRDTFKTVQVVPAATLGLSALADSIRITFTVKLHNLCDAWGNLKTPVGTYATLRFKNTVNIDFKLEGKRNALPIWITIPLSSLPIELPSNQDNVSFIWVNQNGKYFLAEATMIPNDINTLDEIRFQVPRPISSGYKELRTPSTLVGVYPNPVSNQLFINTAEFGSKPITIEVYDNAGRLVVKQTQQINKPQILLDCTELNNGLYWLKIQSDNQVGYNKVQIQH